jgi:hypothetical protein
MAQTIVTLSGDDAELYKAFQRILDQQAKTDAGYKKIRNSSKEAADAAKAAAKEQADAERHRQQKIDSAITSVTSLATAYISVSSAVTALTAAHEILVSNQDKALGKAKELAAAQQEAAKNLAGKTPQAISETLQKTVPEIARETQFSDLAKLTTALGSAASIVGEEQAKSVVTESARLTRFTPDQLQTTATATADIMAATGLGDAKEALALLASTGSVARPEELAKLAQGAAASVNAAIAQAPQQDKVDAAREGVALYAKLSKVDPSGQSAATATTDFIRQISAAFADPKIVKERTERIETLRLSQTDNQLAVEAAKLKIQDTERTAGFFQPTDQTPEANTARLRAEQAKQDLAQAELKARRDAKELDTLSVIQRVTTGQGPSDPKREALTAQLEALRSEARQKLQENNPAWAAKSPEGVKAMAERPDLNMSTEQFGDVVTRFREVFKELQQMPGGVQGPPKASVPITFAERLDAVRATPELRASVSEGLTGEAKFRPLFAELLNANSQISQELKTANSTITTDVKAFEQVAASTVETPQARVVAAANQFETARNIQQSSDTEGQVRAAVSAIFHDAMSSTSVDYVSGTSSVAARVTQYMTRSSEDAGTFGGSEIRQLQERMDYLQNVGADPKTVETSAAAIEAINKLLILPERLELMRQQGEDTNKFLAMQLEAMALTNRILQTTQDAPNTPNQNNLRGMLMAPGANAGAAP